MSRSDFGTVVEPFAVECFVDSGVARVETDVCGSDSAT